jgi:hypothetical protein
MAKPIRRLTDKDTVSNAQPPKPKPVVHPASELKEVGFWKSKHEPDYPDPQALVDPNWEPGDRDKIIAYLKGGLPIAHYLGYSSCRFKCGIDEHELGSADLSDGEWVWPEGLFHYVEKHNVKLPDEFVARMRAKGWQPQ